MAQLIEYLSLPLKGQVRPPSFWLCAPSPLALVLVLAGSVMSWLDSLIQTKTEQVKMEVVFCWVGELHRLHEGPEECCDLSDPLSCLFHLPIQDTGP